MEPKDKANTMEEENALEAGVGGTCANSFSLGENDASCCNSPKVSEIPVRSNSQMKKLDRYNRRLRSTDEWKRTHWKPYRPPIVSEYYQLVRVFGSRKYKPVALKVKPQKAELPEEYRVVRNIIGDPLEGMPELPTNPPDFTPGERYTEDQKEIIDKMHDEDFLWPEERKLLHE